MMEKHNREALVFFGQALLGLLAFGLAIIALSFFIPKAGAEEGVNSAEFSGIELRTRYQKSVKINTPILLQIENETRVLNLVLKNPATAKFSVLFKITPADLRFLRRRLIDDKNSAMFTSSKSAYFLGNRENVRIDEITLIFDNGPNKWLDDYKDLIEGNFRNCQMGLSPKGDPDMVCPPLWVTARITKIERSTLSPDLPQSHVFPHLDYVDIYIEVLQVSKTRP